MKTKGRILYFFTAIAGIIMVLLIGAMAFCLVTKGDSVDKIRDNFLSQFSFIGEIQAKEEGETVKTDEIINEEKIDSWIKGHSIEDKVAQLLLVTPAALTGNANLVTADNTVELALRQYPVGGFVFTKENIPDEETTKQFFSSMYEYSSTISGVAPFMALSNMDDIKVLAADTLTLDNIHDMPTSQNQAMALGGRLKEFGINLNTSLVANEESQEMTEGFAGDLNQITDLTKTYFEGLKSQNVITSVKYFPVSGDFCDMDEATLLGNAVVFKSLIDSGIELVQMSDTRLNLLSKGMPATLSNKAVTEILRKKLGFNGIIVSGDLSDERITTVMDSKEAAVTAISAGCDMIYCSLDFREAYEAIVQAVWSKDLDEDRINESVKRVLKVKYQNSI
ncbi:Glycosyl hydrolase family 3 N terminal domain-containing protein [Acetitomaculum ruminis DSM 5522]|uniref:Glycosyl hydrolase family 3 N terminal domain-containing protein n=1 Tax=Acetitomaculum ruminis DSM 5522 TaxID=1120918 RepID=A0A1I0YDB2_9FIRM|nr:glycoside hydrolase family 3 N-terminal domain-containing protein [Acetitomaculum ruminis]SFB10193.1 Glycosyl hydrolase family 3 N terminal domain-containing protein [Acetitomaculum ruminis DSM 5522]